MHVLHIINDLRVAGAERLLTDLAPRQKKAGLTVSVATLARYPSFLEVALRDAGVPLLLPETAASLRSPVHIGRIAERMRSADLVHVHLFPAQLWAALATISLGKNAPPLITTEHNTHNRRRELQLLKPIDVAMYRRYTRIVAISEATRDALAQYLPETREKSTVIENGIALERFVGTASAQERAAVLPEIPIDAPLALSIGRLEAQKDVPTLLAAIAQVEGVHLGLIGEGALRVTLEEMARKLQIRDRIHFLGRRDDVPALLRNADLYIQSSVWEGFGIAAVEAMASGVPVIHSDIPGLRDVVGAAGVGFPAGDARALGDAVRALLADPARRQRMRIAARTQAEQFSIEQSVEKHLALYHALLPRDTES